MRTLLGYRALIWTAIVAAMFSLTVGLLMVVDFVGRGKYELFDTPQYLAIKQQLKDQPGDAQLQQDIRDLDLQLRATYFRNRRFMAMGMYMLLGGTVLAVIAAKWAVSARGVMFQPQPVNPETDEESLVQRHGRWAAVGVVAVAAAVLCGFALRGEPISLEGIKTLSSESPEQPTLQIVKDARAAVKVPTESDGAAQPIAPTDSHPKPEVPADPAGAPSVATPSFDEYRQQWPRFRGPTGSGTSPLTDVPQQWNVSENSGVLWKSAVPLPGPNSPVVWQQRVFVSGATAEEQAVFCFDAGSGQLQWRHDVPVTKPESGELEVMEATGYAAPTMATDGARAYAIFATGDVVALTLDGQELWHRNVGVPKNHYGHASSLATYQDLLIIQLDQALEKDGLSKLVALRGATGETAWEVKRSVGCSWTSPIVVEHGGRWMVITSVNPWLIAYAAADGSELWRAKCLGGEVGPSPVFANGIVYAANEASGMVAVRADGTGDVTQTHILWKTQIGVPDVCSPLVTDKFVLLMTHGVLTCFDATSGTEASDSGEEREPLWEEDLLQEISSSPSQAGNLVYLFSEEGEAFIVEPQADACKRVGECDMGEPVRSSPAFQSGRIYVRGQDHLFCIGAK